MTHTHNGNSPHPERPERSPRRKRGGQPGNQNARKRGLVDRPLTPEQQVTLEEMQREGLFSPEFNPMRFRIADVLLDPRVSARDLLRIAKLIVRLARAEADALADRQRLGERPILQEILDA